MHNIYAMATQVTDNHIPFESRPDRGSIEVQSVEPFLEEETQTSFMRKARLVEVFRKYISYHNATYNSFDKRAKVTIGAYANKMSLLIEFLNEKELLKLLAKDFTTKVAKEYFTWLCEKYQHNYAARVCEICRTVLDYGVEAEIIEINPIASLSIKKTKPKKPPYFSPQQIKDWENYTSTDDNKRKAAHMCVLQIHTGFDYGDFGEVSREHIHMHGGRKYLIKPRHKNGVEQILPLSEKAEEILELYDYKMKLLSNPEHNLYLKEVAADLGIKMHLTNKSFRKLFFMNKLNNEGYHIGPLSKMGGHKRIQTTEDTYASVTLNLIENELNRLGK